MKELRAYEPSFWLRNGHLNTIYAGVIQKNEVPNYRRSIIRTMDDDFLIIDRMAKGFHRLAVLCHGLEGSSQSPYMTSMARFLHRRGFDVICINFRSCGGAINRGLRMYHSGETSDLHMVLKYHQDAYRTIDLIGFSLGGNVVLKYMGENPSRVHHKVRKAVGVSVPVDLAGGAERLTHLMNYPYSRMFLKSLKKKISTKHRQHPTRVDIERLVEVKTVIDFDDIYTGPIHGFDNAQDYYAQSNSLQYLDRIERPSLLINAKDDPFLSEACFPFQAARENPNFDLVVPRHGGHVGFVDGKDGARYHEYVVETFLLGDE